MGSVRKVRHPPTNTLIGEYAADLLSGSNLILCKKIDSVMMYTDDNSPSGVFLAPLHYSGYITLVNSEEDKRCNCEIVKVVIEGALRVVLLARRKILKGQELYYNYGSSYAFSRACK